MFCVFQANRDKSVVSTTRELRARGGALVLAFRARSCIVLAPLIRLSCRLENLCNDYKISNCS